MKPIFEKIEPNPGSSFAVFQYEFHEIGALPFWHIHPEMEIVYIEKGCGVRQIGTHFSKYCDGDLILLGPGIPHSNFVNNDFKKNIEVIIQVNESLLKHPIFELNEFKSILELFQRANHAMSFHGDTKNKVGNIMKKLAKANPFNKFLLLLSVFKELSLSDSYTLLNAGSVALHIQSNDYQRISKIFDWVSKNYHQKITLDEVSDIAGLTANSFCRFFKNVTGKTFTNYLNEYRINKVCELMRERNISITEIMLQTGFTESAYFSRLFKAYINKTPREYRNQMREWEKGQKLN